MCLETDDFRISIDIQNPPRFTFGPYLISVVMNKATNEI